MLKCVNGIWKHLTGLWEKWWFSKDWQRDPDISPTSLNHIWFLKNEAAFSSRGKSRSSWYTQKRMPLCDNVQPCLIVSSLIFWDGKAVERGPHIFSTGLLWWCSQWWMSRAGYRSRENEAFITLCNQASPESLSQHSDTLPATQTTTTLRWNQCVHF